MNSNTDRIMRAKEKHVEKMDAIFSLEPDAKCFGYGNDPLWPENYTGNIPTEAEIQTEIIRLEAQWDAYDYARTRTPEYPDIGDQLDDLYHKGAFSDEMAVKIKAVKDAYPKPE